MITLTDKEQLLLQAAITNATVPDLANSIDFEKVAEVTGHANKGVARIMFKRLMAKIENGGQPTKSPTTSTPPKAKKRKADDMADNGDKGNAKGTKSSRAKNYLIDAEEVGEESNDLKARIKSESQPDALESE